MTTLRLLLLEELVRPVRALLVGAWGQARARRRLLVLWAALGLVLAAVVAPYDLPFLDALSAPLMPEPGHQTAALPPGPPAVHSIHELDEAHHPSWDAARWWSKWGDYPTGTLILVALIWGAGRALRRPRWRRAALAALLAASLAGLTADVCRFTAGRARPRAVDRGQLTPGFHGPRFGKGALDAKYMSFVSAHSATSTGTALGLAVALGPPAWVAVAAAGAVIWSRLYLREHHPSDVILGALVGLLFALPLGWAARQEPKAAGGP